MAMRFYMSAMRFMRSRPPGPVWVNLIAVVAWMQIIGAVNAVFVRDQGFWPGFALTLIFATGYYALVTAILDSIFPNNSDSDALTPPPPTETRQK